MIYAVNVKTKAHRVLSDSGLNILHEERIVQADPDGWIEWQGGECPLPEHAETEIRYRDRCTQTRRAGSLSECWSHEDIGPHDIIAYRPILDTESEPEPPAWDGEGELPPVGCCCLKGHTRVLILAHANVGSPYDPAVVWQSLDEPGDIDWAVSNVFSPIRSEEDRAVEEMRAVIDACEAQSVNDRLRALYRAGYRKEES